MNNVQVSVCVITYNQERYIKKCLESIINQKTEFIYELLISDDGSSDNTREIINKAIEENNNEKCHVRLIHSEKNLGANANFRKLFNAAAAQWITTCEGDDYWLSDNKLHQQLAYVNEHTHCTLLVHPAYTDDNGHLKDIQWPCQQKVISNVGDVISAKAQFAPTSSYFFKSQLISVLPDWFDRAPVGDLYIEIYATSMGECHCLPVYLSAYRIEAEGSWSSNLKEDGKGIKIVKAYESQIACLKEVQRYFNDYNKEIDIKSSHARYACAMGYLMSNNFVLFKQNMKLSKTDQWYDSLHKALYYSRSSKILVKSIMLLKPIIKKIRKAM